jgi:DNA-binding transcriptional regulator YdaS (Cro superfamily)
MQSEIVKRAIAAAGGPTALARELGIRMESLYSWEDNPPKRVAAVACASGIPRHELRPDLWDAPATESREAA